MTQKGRNTREEIIQESMSEFAQYGYEDSSINRICEQNKITKGQLYHHFKGKESLYLACVQTVYQRIEKHHRDGITFSNNIEDNINTYLSVRREFLNTQPHEAIIFYRTLKGNPQPLEEAIKTIRASFLNYNISFFETILGNGNLAKGLAMSEVSAYILMVIEAYNSQLQALQNEPEHDLIKQYDLASAKLIKMLLYGTIERKKESQ